MSIVQRDQRVVRAAAAENDDDEDKVSISIPMRLFTVKGVRRCCHFSVVTMPYRYQSKVWELTRSSQSG